MLLDRLLSRFSIGTKVLILLSPFVLSIAALGFSGLHASGTLQSRIETSNRAMQSLGGFRTFSEGMERFLANPTEAARGDLLQRLATQRLILQDTLEGVDKGSTGEAALTRAAELINAVDAQVDTLWSLHSREVTLAGTMRAMAGEIVASQAEVTAGLLAEERTASADRDALLREITLATRADELAGRLEEVVARANGATPQTIRSTIEPLVAEIVPRRRALADALAARNKNLATDLQKALAALRQALQGAGPEADLLRAIQPLGGLSVALKTLSKDSLEGIGSGAANRSAATAATEAILVAGRQFQSASYRLQIVLAAFQGDPSPDNLANLGTELESFRRDLGSFVAAAAGKPFAEGLKERLIPAIDTVTGTSASLSEIARDRKQSFAAATGTLGAIAAEITRFSDLQKQSASEVGASTHRTSLGVMAFGILLCLFSGVTLVVTLRGPIGRMSQAMKRLAGGAMETAIAGLARGDEIGDMARALEIFKQNAIAKQEADERAARERAGAEAERRDNLAEKAEMDRQIRIAVADIGRGLERLAANDLSTCLDRPFHGQLDKLRTDFNHSLGGLQLNIYDITAHSGEISGRAEAINRAIGDLAKRTEHQAAALEQTAAAMEEITTTSLATANSAAEANRVMNEVRGCAVTSASVVGEAIEAMRRIEAASRHIAQIVDVIDDIAFQTNLLALNAGIEAARAGGAGKGFAVVAQEVRELAQKSAGAAHQIKALIDRSAGQVADGSRLVRETGNVLDDIAHRIEDASQGIAQIAISSQSQSDAIRNVGSALGALDQMTQQNVMMVEETFASVRRLAGEAGELLCVVNRFRLPQAGEADDRREAVCRPQAAGL